MKRKLVKPCKTAYKTCIDAMIKSVDKINDVKLTDINNISLVGVNPSVINPSIINPSVTNAPINGNNNLNLFTTKDEKTNNINIKDENLINKKDVKENKESKEIKDKKERKRNTKNKKILKLEELTLRQLCSFNSSRRILVNQQVAQLVSDVINKKKPCSLRVLEHLITKFSRKYDIRLNDEGEDVDFGDFCIADEYYKHLPKEDSDPCRRGDLIHYYHNGKILETTIAQMSSVISICTTPTIKYAEKNLLMIRKDLNRMKNIKTKKDTSHIPIPTKRDRGAYQLFRGTVTLEL